MLPTENLKEEHRVIERMLRVIEEICQRLDRGRDVSAHDLESVVDFIRTFADRCHHGKEEDLLFPLAASRGVPKEGGPIGVMLIEHDQGRNYVKGMAQALEDYTKGDKSAGIAFATNARGYVQLLIQHIDKEDNILYPMIDNVLSPDDQKEMLKKFDEVEHERIGENKHHQYLHLVEEMEKKYQVRN